MVILALIYYFLLALILFFVINYLDIRTKGRVSNIIISLIYLVVISVFIQETWIKQITNNVYLVIVLEMLIRLFYVYCFKESKKEELDLFLGRYLLTIVLGLIVNIGFINEVEKVLPTGEALKILVWGLIILYCYSIRKYFDFKDKQEIKKKLENHVNREEILSKYVKLKINYNTDIKVKNKKLINLIYAMMVYEDKKRNKFLRKIDNFFFGKLVKVSKLGIMQVESKTFITDSESVIIVSKKLDKMYDNLKVKKNFVMDILNNYYKDKEKLEEIEEIYQLIVEFSKLD